MKLIENWPAHVAKAYSSWVAYLAGIIAAALAIYPNLLVDLMQVVPHGYRGVFAILLGAIVSGGAIGPKLIAQPNLKPKAAPDDE